MPGHWASTCAPVQGSWSHLPGRRAAARRRVSCPSTPLWSAAAAAGSGSSPLVDEGAAERVAGGGLATIVPDCERPDSFHVHRVPSRARQQYWRHRDVSSSQSSGQHVEANRCIQEPRFISWTEVEVAEVQFPVLVRSQACPKECASHQLSTATHPHNTHVCNYEVAAGKQRSICANHSVSVPASSRCGVKACARPPPMPLQPVC